jgi:hypothetical protein
MRIIAIAATLAVALAPNLSLGQGNSGMGSRAAPVGHRQPTTKEVPRDQAAQPGQPTNTAQMSKEDAALERALKNICRGC